MNEEIVIAVCALIVSVVATALSIWFAQIQRNHMKLSIRPIASVEVADYENRVGVFLANRGLGPMLIKTLLVRNLDGIEHCDLLSYMPSLNEGVLWTNYYDSVDGEVLEHGRRFELLVLNGDPHDANFVNSRDKVRQALKDLTVEAIYDDLYGNPMKPVQRTLRFFGRHETT